jgi:hypothetical protein
MKPFDSQELSEITSSLSLVISMDKFIFYQRKWYDRFKLRYIQSD